MIVGNYFGDFIGFTIEHTGINIMTKKSRQVKRMEDRLSKKTPALNKEDGPNRHSRRSTVAFERKIPQLVKKMNISKSLKDTKEIGRKAKQKHVDEVKARTAIRKELKMKK